MDIKQLFSSRRSWIGLGTLFIVFGIFIGALSVWETLGHVSNRFKMLELPGFHELELESVGLYAGIYQHQGAGPIPVAELSKLNIHLMGRDNYEEIPVVMNTTGQTFSQFGTKGMALFNFIIQQPGSYTLSAVYPDGPGPTASVLLMSQAVEDIKPKLIAGGLFFMLFAGLGIWMIIKSKSWASIS